MLTLHNMDNPTHLSPSIPRRTTRTYNHGHATPDIQTSDIQTSDIQTSDIQTPDIQTPDIQTPDIQNSRHPNSRHPNSHPNSRHPKTSKLPTSKGTLNTFAPTVQAEPGQGEHQHPTR